VGTYRQKIIRDDPGDEMKNGVTDYDQWVKFEKQQVRSEFCGELTKSVTPAYGQER
jgi:hypothetical protein